MLSVAGRLEVGITGSVGHPCAACVICSAMLAEHVAAPGHRNPNWRPRTQLCMVEWLKCAYWFLGSTASQCSQALGRPCCIHIGQKASGSPQGGAHVSK